MTGSNESDQTSDTMSRIKLVAGPGIEPGTQGFSVLHKHLYL